MSEMYDRYSRHFKFDRPFQVVTIKRYDNDEGSWGFHLHHWPEGEMPNYKYGRTSLDRTSNITHSTLGLHAGPESRFEAFSKVMLDKGFSVAIWDDLDEEIQYYIIHTSLPIEWHNLLDDHDITDRILLWTWDPVRHIATSNH